VSARLSAHVTLEAQANGNIFACFDGYSVGLGTFSGGAADRAQGLRIGLPLASFESSRRDIDKEIHLLVRRLAITGHSLRDVRSILDAHYLHRDPALAESAIRKLEKGTKTPN
jgi:hypothetical protein